MTPGRKKLLLAAGGVVVVGAMIAAAIKGGGGTAVRVAVEPATRRDIRPVVKASGTINSRIKVNVSANVMGRIDKLYFREGDHVPKGARFVDLDRAAIASMRDQSAAAVRTQDVELTRARVLLRDAELKLARAKTLRGEGLTSSEGLEAAEVARDTQRAMVASAQAGLAQARAALAKADDDLGKTTIHAPIAGTLVALSAEEGENVVTGTMNNPGSVIGVIADMSEVLAEMDVDETDIVGISRDQTAVVRVDAVQGREYQGVVAETGSSAYKKGDVSYFRVKVQLTDPDAALRPGMSARAEIATTPHLGVLTVPIQCVVNRIPGRKRAKGGEDGDADDDSGDSDDSGDAEDAADARKVVMVLDGRKVRAREVTTGISDETHVAIDDGLGAGDQVVTGPYRVLKKLEDGDEVEVEKPRRKRSTAKAPAPGSAAGASPAPATGR